MSNKQTEQKTPLPEEFPAGFYFNLVSFLASCATLAMVYVQLNEFNDARVINSINLLNSPSSGNSGKGKHLEYLYKSGYNIVDMDVSCKGPTILESEECSDPQIVSEFHLKRLSEAAQRPPVQLKADGAWFSSCSFKNQGFILKGNYASFGCNLEGGVLQVRGIDNTLYFSEFRDAQIQAGGRLFLPMVNAEKSSLIPSVDTEARNVPVFMDGGKFTNGQIWLDWLNLRIRNTNISGTKLTGLHAGVFVDNIGDLRTSEIALVSTRIKEGIRSQAAWYWDDNPPLIDLGIYVPLTEIPTDMVVCPSAQRDGRAGVEYTPQFFISAFEEQETRLELHQIEPGGWFSDKTIECEFSNEFWRKHKRDAALRR